MFINKDIEAHVRKLELGRWDKDQKDKIVRNATRHSDGSYVSLVRNSLLCIAETIENIVSVGLLVG